MPWEEVSVMSQRKEFVKLAQAEGANVRELCRRFGISPTTGYKRLSRFRADRTALLRLHGRRRLELRRGDHLAVALARGALPLAPRLAARRAADPCCAADPLTCVVAGT